MNEKMFDQLLKNGQEINIKKYGKSSKGHDEPFDLSGIVESFFPYLDQLSIHQLAEKETNYNKRLKEMPYYKLEMSDTGRNIEIKMESFEAYNLKQELYALRRLMKECIQCTLAKDYVS